VGSLTVAELDSSAAPVVMRRIAGSRTDRLVLVLQLIVQGTRLVRQLEEEVAVERVVDSLVESSEEDGRRGSDDGEDFDFKGNLDNWYAFLTRLYQ